MDPNRQFAIKHEKTVPNGTEESIPNLEACIAALMAGGHCSTKIYMAPIMIVEITVIVRDTK